MAPQGWFSVFFLEKIFRVKKKKFFLVFNY